MATAAMIALVLAGFLALAAGTHRSSLRMFGRLPPVAARIGLLAFGYALLAVSLAVVLAGGDPARGLVEWVGLLTIGAASVVVALWALPGRV